MFLLGLIHNFLPISFVLLHDSQDLLIFMKLQQFSSLIVDEGLLGPKLTFSLRHVPAQWLSLVVSDVFFCLQPAP